MAERKRRQYGTGSVYQRSNGGRWVGAVQAGFLPSGARRTITVTGVDEATVKRRLRDKIREIEAGGVPAASSSVGMAHDALAQVAERLQLGAPA